MCIYVCVVQSIHCMDNFLKPRLFNYVLAASKVIAK